MWIDQLRIGYKSSYDDFEASLKQRVIHLPKKKSIRETVPYFNGSYDFSKINGEIYWEDRTLEYIFEIEADTPDDLEQKKTRFAAWIMNVMEEIIYDPYEPDYHYIGTYADHRWDDDESVEKSTVTVKFDAYPYKIANAATAYCFALPAASEVVKTVYNDSNHPVAPTLCADASLAVQMGSTTYTLPAGTYQDYNFKLEPGANVLTITNSGNSAATLSVEFFAEVF